MTKEELNLAAAKIKFETRWVDKAQARKWLNGPHINNRGIRHKNIDLWARQMKAGEWDLTGDLIRFADTGELIDGQNRLTAIEKADVSVLLCILWNLPRESFKSMDQGARRNAPDLLTMGGITNPNHSAAAIKGYILYKRGFFKTQKDSTRESKKVDIVPKKIYEFAEQNPELVKILKEVRDHIYQGGQRRHRNLARPSTMSLMYVLFYEKNKKLCTDFFEALIFDEDLPSSSPLAVLRQKLIVERQARGVALPPRDEIALFTWTWNAIRRGERLRTLNLSKVYDFPAIL